MTQHNRNNSVNPIFYFFICLTVMVLFDVFLTNSIIHNIFIGTDVYKFIDIVYVQNTGAAFSSFQHLTLALIILAVISVAFIIYYLYKNRHKYNLALYFSCAMLVSGIVCNTYERITLGYVRDFLSLKFMEFPVFNISDILINLGVLAIIVLVITKNYKRN